MKSLYNYWNYDLKIDPYGKCPCGSDNKYKFCCYEKAKGKTFNQGMNSLKGREIKIRKNSKIKTCLHPNKEECSNRIISAHTVQNNRFLNKISKEGMLIMIENNLDEPISRSIHAHAKGRKVATTFKGFCSTHDSEIFKPIDTREYLGTFEQNFLLAYRSFSFQNHYSQEKLLLLRETIKEAPSILKNKIQVSRYKMLCYHLEDIKREEDIFNSLLINKHYSELDSLIIKIKGEIPVVASNPFDLSENLEGKELINEENYLDKTFLPPTYFLNVFPQEGFTFVVLSSFKKDNEYFSYVKKQITEMSNDKLLTFVSNLIVHKGSLNMAINPDFWEELSGKSEILDIIRREITGDKGLNKNLLEKRSFRFLGDMERHSEIEFLHSV